MKNIKIKGKYDSDEWTDRESKHRSGNYPKEPNETLKMKRTIIEMNNSLNGLNTIFEKGRRQTQ